METIVRVKFGSHLYGTSTPESDIDFKSVHIPEATDILLQRAAPSIRTRSREKAEGEKNLPGDIDDESYSLQRFLELLAEGQTGALDMIFAPQESLVVSSDWWSFLVQNRHRFISKKSAAFVGYCRQQANKYGIKGSRVAAAKAASEFFSGESEYRPYEPVGTFLPQIVDKLLGDEHTAIVKQAIGSSGQEGLFFECCGRKVALTAPVTQAAAIFTRIYENYGDRARLAESNEGVDWKALSHAVRVGQEAVELLNTGHITLPLWNANFILDIKQGKLSYETVSEIIESLLGRVEEASRNSSLPDEPDREFMDRIVVNAYHNRVFYAHAGRPLYSPFTCS